MTISRACRARLALGSSALVVGLALPANAGASTARAESTADAARTGIAPLVRGIDRTTGWEHVATIPLVFDTFHPQGLARVGDRLFLSSVEILEPTERYPEPLDGYDRTPGRGVGHLFVLDLEGNLLADVVLGEGDVYHPGGIDTDGTSVWVPVAEYRPDSASIV